MIKDISFDEKSQAFILEVEDGARTYRFISRYYANKWIKNNVPEIDQKMWKVFEIDGYYRIFRFMEYEF